MLEQLQAEAAVGAADDVAVGIDAVNLRLEHPQQLRRHQVRLVDDRKVAVAQLAPHHLHVLNLLHEVVRVNQTDDALHRIVLHQAGVFLALQNFFDVDRVGQAGHLHKHHLRLAAVHVGQRLRQGVLAAAALQRAVVQHLDRDVLILLNILPVQKGRLGEDDADLFVRVLAQDAEQGGGFARADKAGQAV